MQAVCDSGRGQLCPQVCLCVFSYLKQRHGAVLSFMSGMAGGRALAGAVLSLKGER